MELVYIDASEDDKDPHLVFVNLRIGTVLCKVGEKDVLFLPGV